MRGTLLCSLFVVVVVVSGEEVFPVQAVVASSTVEHAGWGTNKVIDGVMISTWASNGLHTKQGVKDPNTVEWFYLDLGKTISVSRVTLHPANPSGFQAGFGFPRRFKIELSDSPSFTAPVTFVDHTTSNYPNPGTTAQTFSGWGAGRYVRVLATVLSPTSFGDFGLAMAEAVVHGRASMFCGEGTHLNCRTYTRGDIVFNFVSYRQHNAYSSPSPPLVYSWWTDAMPARCGAGYSEAGAHVTPVGGDCGVGATEGGTVCGCDDLVSCSLREVGVRVMTSETLRWVWEKVRICVKDRKAVRRYEAVNGLTEWQAQTCGAERIQYGLSGVLGLGRGSLDVLFEFERPAHLKEVRTDAPVPPTLHCLDQHGNWVNHTSVISPTRNAFCSAAILSWATTTGTDGIHAEFHEHQPPHCLSFTGNGEVSHLDYSHNEDLCWDIRCDGELHIEWPEFDTEANYDFVTASQLDSSVWTGYAHREGHRRGDWHVFSGGAAPSTTTFFGRGARIQFHSDHSVQRSGFRAKWTCVPAGVFKAQNSGITSSGVSSQFLDRLLGPVRQWSSKPPGHSAPFLVTNVQTGKSYTAVIRRTATDFDEVVIPPAKVPDGDVVRLVPAVEDGNDLSLASFSNFFAGGADAVVVTPVSVGTVSQSWGYTKVLPADLSFGGGGVATDRMDQGIEVRFDSPHRVSMVQVSFASVDHFAVKCYKHDGSLVDVAVDVKGGYAVLVGNPPCVGIRAEVRPVPSGTLNLDVYAKPLPPCKVLGTSQQGDLVIHGSSEDACWDLVCRGDMSLQLRWITASPDQLLWRQLGESYSGYGYGQGRYGGPHVKTGLEGLGLDDERVDEWGEVSSGSAPWEKPRPMFGNGARIVHSPATGGERASFGFRWKCSPERRYPEHCSDVGINKDGTKVPWVDSRGFGCGMYDCSVGHTYRNDGFTANEACCACGGGLERVGSHMFYYHMFKLLSSTDTTLLHSRRFATLQEKPADRDARKMLLKVNDDLHQLIADLAKNIVIITDYANKVHAKHMQILEEKKEKDEVAIGLGIAALIGGLLAPFTGGLSLEISLLVDVGVAAIGIAEFATEVQSADLGEKLETDEDIREKTLLAKTLVENVRKKALSLSKSIDKLQQLLQTEYQQMAAAVRSADPTYRVPTFDEFQIAFELVAYSTLTAQEFETGRQASFQWLSSLRRDESLGITGVSRSLAFAHRLTLFVKSLPWWRLFRLNPIGRILSRAFVSTQLRAFRIPRVDSQGVPLSEADELVEDVLTGTVLEDIPMSVKRALAGRSATNVVEDGPFVKLLSKFTDNREALVGINLGITAVLTIVSAGLTIWAIDEDFDDLEKTESLLKDGAWLAAALRIKTHQMELESLMHDLMSLKYSLHPPSGPTDTFVISADSKSNHVWRIDEPSRDHVFSDYFVLGVKTEQKSTLVLSDPRWYGASLCPGHLKTPPELCVQNPRNDINDRSYVWKSDNGCWKHDQSGLFVSSGLSTSTYPGQVYHTSLSPTCDTTLEFDTSRDAIKVTKGSFKGYMCSPIPDEWNDAQQSLLFEEYTTLDAGVVRESSYGVIGNMESTTYRKFQSAQHEQHRRPSYGHLMTKEKLYFRRDASKDVFATPKYPGDGTDGSVPQHFGGEKPDALDAMLFTDMGTIQHRFYNKPWSLIAVPTGATGHFVVYTPYPAKDSRFEWAEEDENSTYHSVSGQRYICGDSNLDFNVNGTVSGSRLPSAQDLRWVQVTTTKYRHIRHVESGKYLIRRETPLPVHLKLVVKEEALQKKEALFAFEKLTGTTPDIGTIVLLHNSPNTPEYSQVYTNLVPSDSNPSEFDGGLGHCRRRLS